MKIYLSHSSSFNYKKELYQPIKKEAFFKYFILPHENSGKQNPIKKLFLSKKCRMIVAEVSFPSTGQGMELDYANIHKIPIICFYKKGFHYSKALTTITKKFIEYNDSKDLIEKIRKIL